MFGRPHLQVMAVKPEQTILRARLTRAHGEKYLVFGNSHGVVPLSFQKRGYIKP